MAGNNRPNPHSQEFDQARNELFSHILRCGVIEATLDHQKEWFDDTMDYLAERYGYLSDDELDNLRELGERYCRPVINRADDASPSDEVPVVEVANAQQEEVAAAN